MTKANNIDIWFETFGNKEDPVLLLIMGACSQGILWPSELCQKLASVGFYVIRYDHRDTGLSTHFDFEKNPYDLMDMSKDAIGLLDSLKIKKAHLMGLSMGGPIAELIAVHFPEYVHSITLMATSCDFRPMNLAYAGLPPEENSLSRPKDFYIEWIASFKEKTPKNLEEAIEQRVECWRLLNGAVIPFEEELYRKLHKEFLLRQRNPESIKNHFFVCSNSEQYVRSVSSKVKVPTLILHGSEDPIFPSDHGEMLAMSIEGSKYIPLYGMGHVPNRYFYDLIVQEVSKLKEV